MGDMLSQAEIDALLGNSASSDTESASAGNSGGSDSENNIIPDVPDTAIDGVTENPSIGAFEVSGALTDEQKDILGELGNISMGTSATTLFALLNTKVLITTPKVRVIRWKDLAGSYDRPCVGIRVNYIVGLQGTNILMLKQNDVKIIADLMMGGNGEVKSGDELNEIDLSAISEAMNQMIGSSSTSLSSMVGTKIDIDTPYAMILDFTQDDTEKMLRSVDYRDEDILVCTSFRMEVGNLIDSEIMQVLPLEMAINMVSKMMAGFGDLTPVQEPVKAEAPIAAVQPQQEAPVYIQQPVSEPQRAVHYQQQAGVFSPEKSVNVKPVVFESFDIESVMQQKENIEIIRDVPLEVSVELGRTKKKIKDILEFVPGKIFELDKLAGEPIDVLVNGKYVAKGEVVVIDENFGIRITEIIGTESKT